MIIKEFDRQARERKTVQRIVTYSINKTIKQFQSVNTADEVIMIWNAPEHMNLPQREFMKDTIWERLEVAGFKTRLGFSSALAEYNRRMK